jgi:hypothetical protein
MRAVGRVSGGPRRGKLYVEARRSARSAAVAAAKGARRRIIGVRSTSKQAQWLRATSTRLTPVWPNLPSAEAFLPLAALLVVVFPGLVALLYGGLTAESAFWGRCGQEVLAGDFWLLGQDVRGTPPLFPWCTALALASGLGDPIARLSLPSYLFWLLSAVVVHQLVRCWFDSKTALLTCVLLAINPAVLYQVQHGLAGTCILFWSTLGLWAYMQHLEGGRPWIWVGAGGGALAGLFLSSGPTALWLPALTTTHLVYEQARSRRDGESLWRRLSTHPSLRASLVVGGVAAALAGYWIWRVEFATPVLPSARTYLGELVLAMPSTIVLAGFGLLLAARLRFRRVGPERQSSMPVLWAVAGLAVFALGAPTTSGLLLAVVPLTLLAVRALEWIVDRRLRDRVSYWLVLATFWVFVLSRSPALVSTGSRIVSSWLSSPEALALDPARRPDVGWQLFEMHVVLDVLLAGSVLLAWLYRLSGRRDRFRRLLFGGFAATVVAASLLIGAFRIAGAARADAPWRSFYAAAAARGPFDWYAFLILGESRPTDEIEFLARALSPGGERFETRAIQEIDRFFNQKGGRPLVLADRRRAAPAQFKLSRGAATATLTVIYEDESVVAFAVDEESTRPARSPRS